MTVSAMSLYIIILTKDFKRTLGSYDEPDNLICMQEKSIYRDESSPYVRRNRKIECTDITNHQFERRSFLQFVGAGGLAALAGCIGTDDSDGADGTLTVAEATEPDELNPIMTSAAEGTVAARWAYSSLTWIDWDNEVRSDLATDWSSNDERDVWRFELRDDATFYQSGNSVIADDVKATYETVYDPSVASPGEGSLGPIDSVEVVSDTEVEVTLERPYSQLPRALALNWGLIVEENALEEHFDELNQESHGSGPFILDEYEPGSHARFVKNEDYYLQDEAGEQLPYIDVIDHQYIPESSARMNTLQTGDIDLLRTASAEEMDQIEPIDGISPVEEEGGWVYPIIMNHQAEPFDDNRVRQAFKYAMDQERIVEVAQLGYGSPAENHSPVAPMNESYTTDLTPDYGTEARPEEARSLLEEAGYDNGLEIEHPLLVPSERAPPIRDIAELTQDQMEEVDVHFDLEEVTWDRFLSEVEAQEPFYVSSYSAWEVEYQGLHIQLHSDGAWNGVKWENEDFDEAIENAIQATDPEEQIAYYQEAQQLTHEFAGYVAPFDTSALSAVREGVQGYEPNSFEQTVHAEYIQK